MYSIKPILRCKALNPASKLVYLYLQDKAYSNQDLHRLTNGLPSEEGNRFIKGTSLKEISEATGITSRTVSRCLDKLEEEGMIKRIPQKTEIGTTAYNRFKIYEIATEERHVIAEV